MENLCITVGDSSQDIPCITCASLMSSDSPGWDEKVYVQELVQGTLDWLEQNQNVDDGEILAMLQMMVYELMPIMMKYVSMEEVD